MASSSKAALHIATHTGREVEDLRTRALYMRRAGLLPEGTRGPHAKGIDEKQAVALLLATMGGGPQTKSGETVATLYGLRHSHRNHIERDAKGQQVKIGPAPFLLNEADEAKFLAENSLGDVLAYLTRQCHTEASRAAVQATFKDVSIWRDGNRALIETTSGLQYWFARKVDAESIAPTLALFPLRHMVTAPIGVLALLSDLTKEQAKQAALNLTAETKSAALSTRPGAADNSVSVSLPAGKPEIDPLYQGQDDTADSAVSRERDGTEPPRLVTMGFGPHDKGIHRRIAPAA